jgi:hypothetical protein
MLREYFDGTCVAQRSISTIYVSLILMVVTRTALQKKIHQYRVLCDV